MASATSTLPHHPSNRSTMTSSTSTPTTAITATALMSASPHDIAQLHDIHTLLNNIFARNRNQHQRSTWWKGLHAFRKQVHLLLQELLHGPVKEREGKVEARLRFWDRGAVHTWYYQFSQLVAVGPFAMLGLVMMASVARVCRITGITAVYEEIASGDIKGVLSANDELALAAEFSGALDEGDEWDEGVLVAREEVEEEDDDDDE